MSTSAIHDGEHSVISSAALNAVQSGFPERICFGAGAARTRLPAELRHAHAERVLFLCSARHAATVRQLSGEASADLDVEVVVLAETDTSFSAVRVARARQFDAVVAVGSGTLIDRAKAAAKRRPGSSSIALWSRGSPSIAWASVTGFAGFCGTSLVSLSTCP